MRADGRRVLRIIVSPEEDAIVTALRTQGRYLTDANLLRDALWSMADEAGMTIPEGAFRFGKAGNTNPWQAWAGKRAAAAARRAAVQTETPPKKKRSNANHPWRQQWYGKGLL